MENPYKELISAINRGSSHKPLILGEVKSAEPLIVSLGEVDIDRDNLLIDENILTERSVDVSDPISGTIKGKVNRTLKAGDNLVIFQISDSMFVAISKVI